MNGLAEGIQTMAIGYGILTALLLLTMALIIAVAYVQQSRAGRLGRLKSAARGLGIAIGVTVFAVVAVSYQANVRARVSATHFDTERSSDGIYTARYAYISRGMVVLRLYRTADMSLLSERTYAHHGDAVDLIWTRDSLIYDTGADTDGSIALPPSWLDRVTAYLP